MKTMILAALVAATAPLAPATAQIVNASATVATHDLDLSRTHDRQRLDRRIVVAARNVCGEASSFDVRGRRNVAACVDAVRARAVPARDALLVRAGGVALAAR